jgi:hypothetical protein
LFIAVLSIVSLKGDGYFVFNNGRIKMKARNARVNENSGDKEEELARTQFALVNAAASDETSEIARCTELPGAERTLKLLTAVGSDFPKIILALCCFRLGFYLGLEQSKKDIKTNEGV